jgi:hypothetical protein
LSNASVFGSHLGILPHLIQALAPGGLLVGCGVQADVFSREVTLSGFVDVRNDDNIAVCSRPPWTTGEVAKLPFKPRAAASAASTGATKSWLRVPSSVDNAATALVDEESLLEADLSAPLPTTSGVSAAAGGCATKRRACKDCTCGRKEELEAASAVPLASAQSKSSCGNVRGERVPLVAKARSRETLSASLTLLVELVLIVLCCAHCAVLQGGCVPLRRMPISWSTGVASGRGRRSYTRHECV